MKKYEVVKSNELFNDVINTGKKTNNKYFIIFSKKKDTYKPNFGIAVGKKIGNAVRRNKVKRQVRTIIDNNKKKFSNNFNYIIMVKKGYNDISFKEASISLQDLIGKVKNEK